MEWGRRPFTTQLCVFQFGLGGGERRLLLHVATVAGPSAITPAIRYQEIEQRQGVDAVEMMLQGQKPLEKSQK